MIFNIYHNLFFSLLWCLFISNIDICLHVYKEAFYQDNTLHILGKEVLLMYEYVNSFCATDVCIYLLTDYPRKLYTGRVKWNEFQTEICIRAVPPVEFV
jgi:hypothetical protein